MVRLTTTLQQFAKQGDKTGWTYVLIPVDIAGKLQPGNRKGFKVKGRIDLHKISAVALIPMGKGDFIIPINASMRKAIGKRKGATVKLELQVDAAPYIFNQDFMDCLADEPSAMKFFESLTPSHQRYFGKWIDTAKTDETRTKRIAQSINGLAKKWDYGSVVRGGPRLE